MKKTASTLGLLLAGLTAQAGIIESVDGLGIEGGTWAASVSREALVGWTVTASGADVRGTSSTVSFGAADDATIEMGNFSAGARLGRDFFRDAGTSLDTNGGDLDSSFSWFQDGDTLDFSGPSAGSINFTTGLTAGSNWAFIDFDSAPINYTGYTVELGGVSQVALELIWDDKDSSGTRSTGDTYDIGTILYATGGDTFNGGSWSGGAPTIPEPGTYALLAGLTGFVFVALRRRK